MTKRYAVEFAGILFCLRGKPAEPLEDRVGGGSAERAKSGSNKRERCRRVVVSQGADVIHALVPTRPLHCPTVTADRVVEEGRDGARAAHAVVHARRRGIPEGPSGGVALVRHARRLNPCSDKLGQIRMYR